MKRLAGVQVALGLIALVGSSNILRAQGAAQAENDPKPENYATKAQVVAFLKKSVSDGAAEIQREGDAGVLQHLSGWIGYTTHMGEHYGLIVAYYRASGAVPPESRPKK